jgi:diguanylate cyclase (GGDEF)-like protein
MRFFIREYTVMMKYLDKVRRIEWRGSTRGEGTTHSEQPETGPDRVALLVGGGNRTLLAKHLQQTCELVHPSESHLIPGSFDMAIVDIEGLRIWRDQLLDEKVRQEPTFLPIVLMLSNRELRYRIKTFWDTIDEFIISPIEPREFNERIALLLRTRRLALAQRAHLAYLVNHDRVTGLPNKNLFMERLTDAVRDASILDQQLHVAVIRISMSRVMQSVGHTGLERIASLCSTRLVTMLRNEIYIARLTTEDWGLIYRPGESLAKVIEICSRIQKLADEPMETNGEQIHLTPRIGIGVYPNDGADANRTLDSAMSALSDAKGTAPIFYSRNVQHDALRFIRTQARLHEALKKQQFELWFQPQLSFATGELVGVEALVRWRLPSGEMVPPNEFMSVAEATGQIVGIDRWVLEKACETMRGWQQCDLGVNRVSVNVTVADIEAPDFVDLVKKSLRKHKLPPPSLELELTETALLDTTEENLEKLDQLREYGISVAVDDFGTGYSSLGYLHKLPITTLKIDKAFVDNIATSATDAAIAETIVWLAKKFDLETVAEGVETKEQADILKSLNVTTAQGYFYGRPMPEDKLKEWVKHLK